MKHSGDGFTLVEVMVALSILSLVMLTTVTGLRTLGNTQGAIERMTGRVDEVRTVSSFLRDTMESAVLDRSGGGGSGLQLGGGGSGSGGGSAYFDLTAGSLAWKSTVLFGEAFGGSYLVRVAREGDELVLRWLEPDHRGQPLDWDAAQERALVAGLEEFEVSWRKTYQGEWLQDWKSGDVAGWVRLQVKASGRYWPDLIMQVPN